MKKLLSVMAVACVAANMAWAEAPAKKKTMAVPREEKPAWSGKMRESSSGTHHKMAGCGLGSMLIEDQGSWMQILAATLNGTGGQTFAITTGTSNCTQSGLTQASREKEAFIEANYADVQRDIAVGSGEYVDSLASLYGCKSGEFGKSLQENRSALINKSAQESVQAINEIVQKNTKLAESCQG